MKFKFFFIFILFIFLHCKKQEKPIHKQWVRISEQLRYCQNSETLQIQSGKNKIEIKNNQLPLKKVVLLNASLIGYFQELNALDVIKGVSSPDYLSNPQLQKDLLTGRVKNMGNEQKYNLELMLSEKPDAIVSNYISSFEPIYKLLKTNGINLIFLDEYKEKLPLEKAAYLKLFGKLLGKENRANLAYQKIETHYNTIKNRAKTAKYKPVVIANSLYANQWFMPSGNSYIATLFRDANAQYPWKDTKSDATLALSFEEVLQKSQNANYWVNIGSFRSKKELLTANIHYQKLPCFNHGKLYTYYKRAKDKKNDYFETGVVRVDLVLEDYVKLFHPELFPKESTTYFMSEVK